MVNKLKVFNLKKKQLARNNANRLATNNAIWLVNRARFERLPGVPAFLYSQMDGEGVISSAYPSDEGGG